MSVLLHGVLTEWQQDILPYGTKKQNNRNVFCRPPKAEGILLCTSSTFIPVFLILWHDTVPHNSAWRRSVSGVSSCQHQHYCSIFLFIVKVYTVYTLGARRMYNSRLRLLPYGIFCTAGRIQLTAGETGWLEKAWLAAVQYMATVCLLYNKQKNA